MSSGTVLGDVGDLAFCIAFVIFGLVMATNFRGVWTYTADDLEETAVSRFLNRIPPWSWTLTETPEDRARRTNRWVRIIGCILVFGGTGLTVVTIKGVFHSG